MTDATERVWALFTTMMNMRDALPPSMVTIYAKNLMAVNNLAIIDTTTHKAVRVHRFDKDDPATWPKMEHAPSGAWWLVRTRNEWKSLCWHPVFGMAYDTEWFDFGVTAYYDPADLTGA